METLRTLLFGILLLIAYLLWNAWQTDYSHPAQANQSSVISETPPKMEGLANLTTRTTAMSLPSTTQSGLAQSRQWIRFKTDTLSGVIDTRGGHLVHLALLHYPQSGDAKKNPPFNLLDQETRYYVAQTGLRNLQEDNTQSGEWLYTSPTLQYNLLPGQQELQIDLRWQDRNRIVTKRFLLKRGDYQVRVQYHLRNRGTTPWQTQLYNQLQRKGPMQSGGGLLSLPAYVGGAISTQTKPYEKIPFDKMGAHSLSAVTQPNWIALVEPYFLSAWVPNTTQAFQAYSAVQGELYTLGMLGPMRTIMPGQQHMMTTKLYAGPAVIEQLKAAATHLELNVDYGMLWFISTGLFWLLKQFHQFIGNWGWAIVFVTILLKLAFYGLSAKSFRSMAAMRKLQPRLQSLKERYGDDRQKIAQATMELYRSERVSPLGGCLPMLIQIPVFIALYWVLLESVELRQAPFMLWIRDLSAKDPFYVLPILMGISMFLQQKLSPSPTDPMQAKVMLLLPVLFTVIFLNFPAGLVLYWLVNNTLSILQQWWMMRATAS